MHATRVGNGWPGADGAAGSVVAVATRLVRKDPGRQESSEPSPREEQRAKELDPRRKALTSPQEGEAVQPTNPGQERTPTQPPDDAAE